MELFNFDVTTVNAYGEKIGRFSHQAKHRRENLGSELILEMVEIPAGSFIMGSPTTELGATKSQIPQRSVNLSYFLMGKYPITQAQWRRVAKLPQIAIELNPYSSNFEDLERPVEQVSWFEAQEWCARLSQLTGRAYRLPTEAEWEYACRANTTTPFHFGETITTRIANYSGVDWEYQGKICSYGAYGNGPQGEDRRETTRVGYFGCANSFGLYDMHGNVREWCADYWHNNYQGAPQDGSAWLEEGDPNTRVLRGGSWNCGPRQCRSASRQKLDPDASLYDVGFRVVCNL